MIPSDHFVRFYNEVFKFLESQGEEHLRKYWRRVSEHQERHCLDLFREKGLKGMKEYWERIAIEENCDMDFELTDDYLKITMNKCPSLSKAMDNDAGAMTRYCDHCPGWIVPLIEKAGYFICYDVKSRTEPICEMSIFKNRQDAENAKERAQLVVD